MANNSLDIENFINTCEFSSIPISSFADKANLRPILLKSYIFKLEESHLSQLLDKSIEQNKIPLEENLQTLNELIQQDYIHPQPKTCSDCQGPGSMYLKCGHYTCGNCVYSNAYCTECKQPRSFYDLMIDFHLCLKCKKFDTRDRTCKHYCSDCIIGLVRIQQTFKCEVCPKVFNYQDFINFECACQHCSKQGRMMEDCFVSICDKHLVCSDCAFSFCKYSTCFICKKFISAKEIFRIKKKFMFCCEECFNLKQFDQDCNKVCCSRRVCDDCYLKVGCRCQSV